VSTSRDECEKVSGMFVSTGTDECEKVSGMFVSTGRDECLRPVVKVLDICRRERS